MKCEGCELPVPQDFCWQQRLLDCPVDKPPRHMDVNLLWAQVVKLHRRVTALEARLGL